jgi:peptidoglycan/xylan/chitin deacetylase (PgdA/CDA1 family)
MLAAAVLRSPLPEVIFRHRAWKHLTVIAYHRIHSVSDATHPFDDLTISASAEELARELQFFQRHLDVISVPELLSGMKSKTLPPRPALITFDDGYADNHEVAFPILREHRVRACFFVCTQLVGTAAMPWWDHVACCMKLATRRQIASPFSEDDPHYDLHPDERTRSIHRFLLQLKKSPWVDLPRYLNYLQDVTGVNPADHADKPLLMSWAAVRELKAAGMEIGSHTRSHPVLARLHDRSLLRAEIGGSYEDLRRALGTPPLAFAYPVGSRDAISLRAEREVERAGSEISFSYQHRIAPLLAGHRFRVPRLHSEFGENFGAFRLGLIRAGRAGLDAGAVLD